MLWFPNIPRAGKLAEGEGPAFLQRIGTADFKGGWKTSISIREGCLVYCAFKNDANVTLLYNSGKKVKLTFDKGGKVFISFGGKVTYTKPKKTEKLQETGTGSDTGAATDTGTGSETETET